MKPCCSPGARSLGPQRVLHAAGLPHLSAFMGRMAARQGTQAALQAERVLK